MKVNLALSILLMVSQMVFAQAPLKNEPLKSEDMNEQKMNIEVWSDVMCPFCYIGKRHLEAALAEFEDRNRVEIVWKSYQLNPDLPLKIENKESVYAYLAKAKGISYEQSVQMHDNVVQMAAKAGLNYQFDKAVIANSFDAHRLAQFAKTKHLGDQVEELLFKAYFIEGKDISDHETLISLGAEIGITQAEVEEALTNETYAALVSKDIAEAQQIGVRGVPFFVLDRKYAISGAQPTEQFLGALQQSVSEWKTANNINDLQIKEGDGPACTPEGVCE
jgi:predicted DsbA family dithiol-disulfide isomerase